MVSPAGNTFSRARVMFEAGELQQADAVLSVGEIALNKIIGLREKTITPIHGSCRDFKRL